MRADASDERAGMLLADLDYDLPADLIAQEPVEPRDAARLLVYRRPTTASADTPQRDVEGVRDLTFRDLPDLVRPGDLLVRNDTRVLAARTHFRRPSGGRLELLFLHADDPANAGAGTPETAPGGEVWEVLVRGRPRADELLVNDHDNAWGVRVLQGFDDGRWLVENRSDRPVRRWLSRVGEAPLPPYVRRRLADPERYQTTYARCPGSAAAPTAGLHFTPALDERLATAGARVVEITLHVGLGTFKPLAEDELKANRLHRETYAVTAALWDEVLYARAEGRRVLAVGTTAVRTLEHLARTPGSPDEAGMLRGSTDLFIAPGFEFRVVDALVTNFHLPRTSLLALVMAFAGVAETRLLYEHAVRQRYRFYSLGDAMVVL